MRDLKWLASIAGGLAMLWTSAVHAQAPAMDPDDKAKQDIVTAYKVLVNEGILDSFGHVTARSAKNPNVFFMPQAMPPSLVTKDDILEVNVQTGQAIDPKGRRLNGERFIHSEIYKLRPDVMAIIHTHSQAVIPLSLTTIKMRPVVAQAGFLPVETPTYDSRKAGNTGDNPMLVNTQTRGAGLARVLGKAPAVLLRGHGDVIAGASVQEAVVYTIYVDINARMMTQAMLLQPKGIATMNKTELFGREDFDINRPWQHLQQKTLDEAAKSKIDRSQFGLDQNQLTK